MNNNILVTSVEVESESFAEALSIQEAREKERDAIIQNCHDTTSTYSDAIVEISKTVDNPNELADACFHLGAYAENQRAKRQLFGKLFGE